ncbi:hypothetical protein GLE_1633 [Lysobacter enzymogenes]|uniref:Uncharacterized protein n=1 Tax=Lysobacter enzymogenes TaxID=69 RepID=A0A0S2DF16_LYSEN|nr:hypothetical protein [Lysobacter enzymogenes]ALN56990.1 hypothetical protein GLE_1633 [Lysobacter enzymogenes]QCW25697.1 hypothetical protein FE772_08475 [Lysobacter enzymogenes]
MNEKGASAAKEGDAKQGEATDGKAMDGDDGGGSRGPAAVFLRTTRPPPRPARAFTKMPG